MPSFIQLHKMGVPPLEIDNRKIKFPMPVPPLRFMVLMSSSPRSSAVVSVQL
jgi:hypothetical protein